MPLPGADPDYEDASSLNRDIEGQLEEYLDKYKRDFKNKSIIYKDVGTKEVNLRSTYFIMYTNIFNLTQIYSIEVPKATKVPENWVKLSNTQKVSRYWSPEVRTLVQSLKEARETRTSALNSFAKRLYNLFDQDYKVCLVLYN